MEGRAERGLKIAALMPIKRRGGAWRVPSQSKGGIAYAVVVGPRASCSCPDHQETAAKCKHIYAVEYTVQRRTVTTPDGTTRVTEVRKTRVTYKQDWPAYNEAQVKEKEQFAALLQALCAGIEQPPQGRGRPRLPLSDVVFAAGIKVYLTSSGRRASSDLRDLVAKGYMDRAPHYNSIFRYLDRPGLTPLLKRLIEEAALPLKAIETDFAVDSSGFATSVYRRWFDHKWGRMKSEHEWVKAHIMVGTKTHVVTGVEVMLGETQGSADGPQLLPLAAATVQRGWDVQEISADKAYLSAQNLHGTAALGASAYIPFKVNSRDKGTDIWRRAYHFFHFQRDTFLAHYHKRSNVETVFAMVKAKFGASVRSKTPTAQVNELLLKILAHNICCLIHAIYELKLTPIFWEEPAPATEVH